MSRRASLPGAAELFRSTGEGPGDDPGIGPETGVGRPRTTIVVSDAMVEDDLVVEAPAEDEEAPVTLRPRVVVTRRASSRQRAGDDRRSTGRERHDEKITVYVSGEELFDLEHARLVLRGEHGVAIDRGRIVREALAVVLADLEAKGAQSILVRRLREG